MLMSPGAPLAAWVGAAVGGAGLLDGGCVVGVPPPRDWSLADEAPCDSRNRPSPARATTIAAKAAFRCSGVRSIAAAATSGAATGGARTGRPGRCHGATAP